MLHRVLFVSVAVSAALLWTGCSQPPFPVRTYAMGEKVNLGHLVYTVFETQWLTEAGTAPAIRLPQNRFFLVRISAGNSGGNDIIVPNLTVEDDHGHSYPELQNGDAIPQYIGYLRTVAPAEAVAGNLVFDCPPGHYKLRVTDEDGERAALIDIPLNFTNETPDMPIPNSEKEKKGDSDGHTLLPGRY
jgi:hypothetical protein